MGGEASTFAGLTGLGDLVATCVSQHSRNRYVGEQLGTGRSLDGRFGDGKCLSVPPQIPSLLIVMARW